MVASCGSQSGLVGHRFLLLLFTEIAMQDISSCFITTRLFKRHQSSIFTSGNTYYTMTIAVVNPAAFLIRGVPLPFG